MTSTRGKKRPGPAHDHEEHEEHVNHEAWVIPYADMLTLLMALFLVLFAVGRVDTEKFKKMAESFRDEFGSGAGEQVVDLGGGSGSPLDGGSGVLDLDAAAVPETPSAAADEALAEKESAEAAATAAAEALDGVRQAVQLHADAAGLGSAIGFRTEPRGLVVAIVTDQVLFDPGRAELQADGLAILDIIADALGETSYDLAVEGHTDARPIATSRYPSNWELSTARATSVLRYLVDAHGLDPARMAAAGYADTRPLDPAATAEAEARNRRVEIVVLSDVDLSVAEAPGAGVVVTGQS